MDFNLFGSGAESYLNSEIEQMFTSMNNFAMNALDSTVNKLEKTATGILGFDPVYVDFTGATLPTEDIFDLTIPGQLKMKIGCICNVAATITYIPTTPPSTVIHEVKINDSSVNSESTIINEIIAITISYSAFLKENDILKCSFSILDGYINVNYSAVYTITCYIAAQGDFQSFSLSSVNQSSIQLKNRLDSFQSILNSLDSYYNDPYLSGTKEKRLTAGETSFNPDYARVWSKLDEWVNLINNLIV